MILLFNIFSLGLFLLAKLQREREGGLKTENYFPFLPFIRRKAKNKENQSNATKNNARQTYNRLICDVHQIFQVIILMLTKCMEKFSFYFFFVTSCSLPFFLFLFLIFNLNKRAQTINQYIQINNEFITQPIIIISNYYSISNQYILLSKHLQADLHGMIVACDLNYNYTCILQVMRDNLAV